MASPVLAKIPKMSLVRTNVGRLLQNAHIQRLELIGDEVHRALAAVGAFGSPRKPDAQERPAGTQQSDNESKHCLQPGRQRHHPCVGGRQIDDAIQVDGRVGPGASG
jgi:hypothetical protein